MRIPFVAAAAAATTLAALTVHAAGTIRVAANAEIRGTNPGVNRDANTDTVMLHMIEGLVGYKDDGTPAPLLAQSIEVSKDGKTRTVTADGTNASGAHIHNVSVYDKK